LSHKQWFKIFNTKKGGKLGLLKLRFQIKAREQRELEEKYKNKKSEENKQQTTTQNTEKEKGGEKIGEEFLDNKK